MISYGKQTIGDDDIDAVVGVLRSDYLTQGPAVTAFEEALADFCGAPYAVAVSNGTAALHAAYVAAGIGPGDEIITSPMTFAATGNAALFQGAKPVFVDIDPATGNIDPSKIEAAITPRTKAIVPIDYTGRPVDYDAIRAIADRHGLLVIADGCHALGAMYNQKMVGSIADMTAFSFHPVKSITTGEGGAVLTNDRHVYKTMKQFATHGITSTDLQSESPGGWYHEMQLLGNNYRLSDIHAALGRSQLGKLNVFIAKRRDIAARYHDAFASVPEIEAPMADDSRYQSAWHLYVVRLAGAAQGKRAEIFKALRAKNIWVQVHYIPVYYHPYYRSLGYQKGQCPVAEKWYESILSLPIYPTLQPDEQTYVIETIKECVGHLST